MDIKTPWAETSYRTNLQYDQFQNTKQVLMSIQHDHQERINNTLLSQGLATSYIIKTSCQNLKGLWSSVQQNLPRNIFNFSVKYLSNTLPTRKISVGGNFLNRLIAPCVSSQKFYNMLYPAASDI